MNLQNKSHEHLQVEWFVTALETFFIENLAKIAKWDKKNIRTLHYEGCVDCGFNSHVDMEVLKLISAFGLFVLFSRWKYSCFYRIEMMASVQYVTINTLTALWIRFSLKFKWRRLGKHYVIIHWCCDTTLQWVFNGRIWWWMRLHFIDQHPAQMCIKLNSNRECISMDVDRKL